MAARNPIKTLQRLAYLERAASSGGRDSRSNAIPSDRLYLEKLFEAIEGSLGEDWLENRLAGGRD